MPHQTDALCREPERLVREYADLVLRVCYTYLRTTADAEDVCQDTLLKLICRKDPFNGPDHERAWVIRVASNACKNLLRSRSAHPEVELASAGEPEAAPESDEDALRLQDERVLNAVMALPVPQREAVYLHYYEGYGTRSVASILETTDDAVRQRLSRARARLREALKGDFDDFPA
ncbi:MAG: sigma-70 family RNA polymerase sigma factor [Eggerthellaceae bacterium]|nr:sigma-70 family RNA polymerase sigma factor [Eggerthellaceae bacterium]